MWWGCLREARSDEEREEVASKGLEPLTLGSEDRCSNPLSYEAKHSSQEAGSPIISRPEKKIWKLLNIRGNFLSSDSYYLGN